MATIKRKAPVNTAAKETVKDEPIIPVESTLIESKAKETVSVKIKKTGEYGSWGIELMHSIELKGDEDASNVMDGMIETLEMKCAEFSDKHSVLTDQDIEECQAPDEPVIDDEVILDDPVDEGLTEEEVRGMDKKEIIALIKEQELGIDPKNYKKLADLIETVVEALFGEEVVDDEVVDDEVVDGPVEEGLTEEEVREMDRKELIAVIKEMELEIDPADFKKTSDLTDAVVEALFSEELTPDAVHEMTREELIELIEAESLEIDPNKFKKRDALADEIISQLFEDSPEENLEEFGDFDSAE